MLALLDPLPDAGWRRYGVAVAAVAATASFRFVLNPWIGDRLPFVTLFFGVFVAAWYGGLGPALLATALGAATASMIFLKAVGTAPGMNSIALLGMALFIATGVATAWLGETRLRALRLAAAAARQAAAEAERADDERERAEDEAAKAEEAAAEAELTSQEAAESLERQMEAEAALRRSEQELADFFENAAIGLNWVAADGLVLRANRAQLAMLGCGPAEYVGHPIAEFHQDRAVAEGILRRLAAGQVVLEVPSRMRAGSGEARDVVINASPYMQDGRLVHSRYFVRDVTDQKRAEEAVRSLQRLESVGRLAGGMAHEVNNQMTVVLGATDFILRRSDIPADARADVQFIRDAAQRSAGITAQLLAFGRRQIMRPEVLDVNTVVASFEPVLRRTMGGRYEVALELADGTEPVRVDRGQLEQVLLNLALNAADAMPSGGRLTVATARLELTAGDRLLPLEADVQPGRYLELTVSDTGTGMDADTLSRIFEPFFTTKPLGKGNGLGLSTVYGIVRQSGGYVSASSEPGKGSVFRICLPIAAEGAASGMRDAAPLGGGRGESVLVVEDRAEVRQMTSRVLREAGFATLEAADGLEALALLDGKPSVPALALIDVALPNMDGPTLARELERARPGMPVLFMTGYTSDEAMRDSAVGQGHPLIEKPFTADALVRRVRQSLDAGARREASA
jgi:two-component system, cell cycle sensor histidine kinase and response regulator CckA